MTQTRTVDKDQILREVAKYLAYYMDQPGQPETVVLLEHSLAQDCALDSLDSVELLMEVETAFDIEIDQVEAETLITVGDLVDLIAQKLTS